MKLESPCAYQGGKSRIASDILSYIKPDADLYFADVCCGSGAISIELLNQGFPPEKLIMIDNNGFGYFWAKVASGDFSISEFEYHIKQIPDDVKLLQQHIEDISKLPADMNTDGVYVYLLLQASSFGSKAIWVNNGKWCNTSFRSYWLPTETSSRRYPVNPMMPMPKTLLQRVIRIVDTLSGKIHAYVSDIRDVCVTHSNVYIDPPYENTTPYGDKFNVVEQAVRLSALQNSVYVSEARPLSENNVKIAEKRTKGNISGENKAGVTEYLSFFE